VINRIRTGVLLLADAGGYAVGAARRSARFLPELAGLGTVSWGVGMIYSPAGVIAAGVSCILAGAQIPRKPRKPSDDAAQR